MQSLDNNGEEVDRRGESQGYEAPKWRLVHPQHAVMEMMEK